MPKQATVATVHLLINESIIGDAEELLSDLLTDAGIYGGTLIDWCYVSTSAANVYARPKVVDVPDTFEEGDGTLEEIAFQGQRSLPKDTDKLLPRVTPLGDGAFRLDHNYRAGDRVKLARSPKKED